MSMVAKSGGTRFRLYCRPSNLPGFEEPETITLSPPAGTVSAGPCDNRIKVVDARDKRRYDDNSLPPYRGPAHEPASAHR